MLYSYNLLSAYSWTSEFKYFIEILSTRLKNLKQLNYVSIFDHCNIDKNDILCKGHLWLETKLYFNKGRFHRAMVAEQSRASQNQLRFLVYKCLGRGFESGRIRM